MFKIADVDFGVKEAYIDCVLFPCSLYWQLRVLGNPKDVDGEVWRPHAYSDNIQEFQRNKPGHWRDVAGTTLTWSENLDAIANERKASLAVFEHLDIYDSRLRFLDVKDNRIGVEWIAKCDIRYSPEYGSGLTLHIVTDLEFGGVALFQMNDKSEVICRNALSQFMDDSEFNYVIGADGKTPHLEPKTRSDIAVLAFSP